MTYNTYRVLLFWISAFVYIISLVLVLGAAVRIFPAFGFIGVLSADEKLGLMKERSVYIITGTVCVLLTAPDKKIFSRLTLVLSVLSALLLPLGLVLFYIQSMYISSYQISAFCFYMLPFAVTSAVCDLIPAGKRKKTGIYTGALLFCGAVIILFASLTSMYFMTGSVLMLPLILLAMLPVSVITNLIVLLNRFITLFSIRTIVMLYINAVSLPVCVIFIPCNAEIAVSAGGMIFTAGTILSLIFTIYDIRRVRHGE